MLSGIYSAATALDTAVKNHEVIAQNLAHSTVPGYRQQGIVFELPKSAANQGPTAGTALQVAKVYTDFRPGPLQFTGAPFDLALDGADTFFILDGPNGPVYTRNGTFHLNQQGQIVSQAGYPLRGSAGPLSVPPEASKVTIGRDGTVSAAGQAVGQIQLARFQDTNQLTAVGPTLFKAGSAAGLQVATGGVLQGYREGSNVQPAEAMVSMIAGARFYEAAQKALRAIAESVQVNTRPSG